MRAEMEGKLDHMIGLMSKSSPNQIDVDNLRRRALDRIDDLRRDLVKAVDEWVSIMKSHLLSSLGFEEVGKMKG